MLLDVLRWTFVGASLGTALGGIFIAAIASAQAGGVLLLVAGAFAFVAILLAAAR